MDIQLAGIESRIYEIRGQRVMLDFHLAEMYGVDTGQLKRSVRRNIERFEGDDCMFELSKSEWDSLRCQFGISKEKGGVRYLPFAFTELGVSMLSSVLRSPTAIQINKVIMRTFVQMRQMLLNPPATQSLENRMEQLEACLNDILTDQNEINEDNRVQLELINRTLAEMQAKGTKVKKSRRRIGYEGGEIDCE